MSKNDIIILERIRKEISLINECNSISELSNKTGIPTSTIQRDLNDYNRVVEIFGKDVFDEIQNWLKTSKKIGLSNGGKKSQQLYNYEKDELGHFKGVK